MTDAPEKIWAWPFDRPTFCADVNPMQNRHAKPYIPEALAQAMVAKAREDALREAAEICFEYSKDHGSGMFDRHSSECANRICALIALTQIEEGGA